MSSQYRCSTSSRNPFISTGNFTQGQQIFFNDFKPQHLLVSHSQGQKCQWRYTNQSLLEQFHYSFETTKSPINITAVFWMQVFKTLHNNLHDAKILRIWGQIMTKANGLKLNWCWWQTIDWIWVYYSKGKCDIGLR